MKTIILSLAACSLFASCVKNGDYPTATTQYRCYVQHWTPRGTPPYKAVWINFTGSFTDMRTFEAKHTFTDTLHVPNDVPYGGWQVTTCFPVTTAAN